METNDDDDTAGAVMSSSTSPEDVLLKTTDAHENFYRLSRLLVAGGTTVLRDVFDFIHPPDKLATILKDPANKKLIEAKRPTKSQRQLLGYSTPGASVSSASFDISLLSLLLQNICCFSPPGTGWLSMPPDSNTSLSADIIRIRMLRNEIFAHVSAEMAIESAEFINLWKKVSDALVRMEEKLSKEKGEEWRKTIQTFLTEELTEEAKQSARELQNWHLQDTDVKEKLLQMEKRINEIKTSVGELSSLHLQSNNSRPKTCLKKHHEVTPLDHFCHDCREVICNKCASMMHKNHRVEECQKIRMEITDEMIKAEEKLAQDDAEMDSVAQRVRVADSRLEAIEKMLHNFVDKFVDVIKRQEEEMTNEIQRLRLMSAFDAEGIEVSIRRHKSELQTTMEYASALLEQGDYQEMCDEAETVKDALRQQSSFEIIPKPLVAERKTFAPNTSFFDHLFDNGIGRIITVDPAKCSATGKGVSLSSPLSLGVEATFSISTCTPTGDVIHAPYEGMSVIIMYKPETNATFGTFTQDISKNVKDNRDGWYTASYIPTRTGTALVSVKVGGEHISGSPFEVKINQRKYKPVKTLGKKGKGLGYFLGPWCSAEDSDGNIYVTDRDNDRIQVFDKDGSYVRKIGEFGSGDGQLVKPRGIAIDKNGNVIIVDNGNNRVQVFDKNGNFKSKFGGYGDKKGQLNNPYAVAIDGDDNYIISDADNKRVQIFTPEGEVVRVFGNEGKDKIKASYYCIYHEGRYILTDFEDYSIKLFNKEGEFEEKIGKKGMLSGEFGKWLRGLAIDKVGNLLVCDSCADRIQVFQPNGSSFKFLEKFGRFGEKLGQFKQPTTVTVLRDGRFVVCEFHNSRVQILE